LSVSERPAVDGALRGSLARSAQAVGQARGGEAALLPLDRDGLSISVEN
jgi:hypothetical protein